jgi:hypothetical protein
MNGIKILGCIKWKECGDKLHFSISIAFLLYFYIIKWRNKNKRAKF